MSTKTVTKRPFAGPEQVLNYLGRYTHRVAISNERIKSIDKGKVMFTYKDRNDNTTKTMTIDACKFFRRFLLHVLPIGFVKIRYLGFLSHRNKRKAIALIRTLIDPYITQCHTVKETIQQMMLRLTGIDISLCPRCKKGHMQKVGEILKMHPYAQTIIWDSS